MTARGAVAGVMPAESAPVASWRGWRQWALLVGAWSLPGLVTSTQVYLLHQRYDPIPFYQALLWQMPGWHFWVPATPLILFLLRAFPFERGVWQRSLPVHLVAVMALSAAHLAVSIAAGRYLIAYDHYVATSFSGLWSSLFLRNVHLDVVTYASVIAAGFAYTYYRKYRERELCTSQLEARLARAELAALKGQLRPHFLFNTLHAVAVLVRKQDRQRAVETLTRLGDLLRQSLDNAGKQLVPLDEEIEFIEGYLEIQQVRFRDRLVTEVDVCEGCADLMVPNLILQPLVENSIQHGLAPRPEGGRVEIEARREGDRVRFEVRDDGVGLPAGWRMEACRGIGVGNVRARLEQLFGEEQRFEIAERPGGGVVVTVEMPAVVSQRGAGDE